MSAASCIFCKIIKGQIPSHKIYDSNLVYAFLDIGPLSKGHALVIPKFHTQFMHEVPDDALAEILPVAKKIAKVVGGENYNILQNNGRLAHQAVDHVHFHIIPKTTEAGLNMEWDSLSPSQDELKQLAESIRSNLEQ